MADFELIETAADLEALARDLLDEKVVAFDTEADSFYHYFDKTCLVQIATRRQIFLIDPLALGGPEELAPLGPVFASPDIRKIFHAAEYDLFVLKRDCGFQLREPVRHDDLRAAARLSGGGPLARSPSVTSTCSLPKDEQRSDWSARPLATASSATPPPTCAT